MSAMVGGWGGMVSRCYSLCRRGRFVRTDAMIPSLPHVAVGTEDLEVKVFGEAMFFKPVIELTFPISSQGISPLLSSVILDMVNR